LILTSEKPLGRGEKEGREKSSRWGERDKLGLKSDLQSFPGGRHLRRQQGMPSREARRMVGSTKERATLPGAEEGGFAAMAGECRRRQQGST